MAAACTRGIPLRYGRDGGRADGDGVAAPLPLTVATPIDLRRRLGKCMGRLWPVSRQFDDRFTQPKARKTLKDQKERPDQGEGQLGKAGEDPRGHSPRSWSSRSAASQSPGCPNMPGTNPAVHGINDRAEVRTKRGKWSFRVYSITRTNMIAPPHVRGAPKPGRTVPISSNRSRCTGSRSSNRNR